MSIGEYPIKPALPPRTALQDPDDWLDAAARATRSVVRRAGVAEALRG